MKTRGELRAALERLEHDAARYRWLRDHYRGSWITLLGSLGVGTVSEADRDLIDKEIDAARNA